MDSSSEEMSLKATILHLEKRIKELESKEKQSCSIPVNKTKEIQRIPQKRTSAPLLDFDGDHEKKPVPTYEQLFCFPIKKSERDPQLLYGKEFLAKHYANTIHPIHCNNLRTVRAWMKKLESKHFDLRHNKDGKDELMAYIQEHHEDILALKFSSAQYTWDVRDIYTYCLRYRQAKRKNQKKNAMASSSSIVPVSVSGFYNVATL